MRTTYHNISRGAWALRSPTWHGLNCVLLEELNATLLSSQKAYTGKVQTIVKKEFLCIKSNMPCLISNRNTSVMRNVLLNQTRIGVLACTVFNDQSIFWMHQRTKRNQGSQAVISASYFKSILLPIGIENETSNLFKHNFEK